MQAPNLFRPAADSLVRLAWLIAAPVVLSADIWTWRRADDVMGRATIDAEGHHVSPAFPYPAGRST